MSTFKKYPKFLTPRGVAIFPKLHAPDTKWKKEGEYTVKLRLDPEAPGVGEFRAQLEAELAKFVEEKSRELPPAKRKTLKQRPVFQTELNDEGEETGFVIIKASMRASGVSKKDGLPWTRKPSIFDAKGNKLSNVPRIGGGSELKLAGEIGTYYNPKDNEAGVTLYLSAAQVLVLREFGSGSSASDYGFGTEEGFAAEESGETFGGEGAATTGGDDAAVSGDDF
jgi:hypothetical protein